MEGCILSLITKTKDVRMSIIVVPMIRTDTDSISGVLQRCTLPSRDRSRMLRDSWCRCRKVAGANAVESGSNEENAVRA